MAKLSTEWKSDAPNPDEAHLKTLWQAEIENKERTLAQTVETKKRQETSRLTLLKATGLGRGDVDALLKEDADISKKALAIAEKQLLKPPIDFEALHKLDSELAQANAARIEGHNPAWHDYIWNPSYSGWWMSWNGETEERPSITTNTASKRLDPRAQAWGEGWYDEDHSEIHAYLSFTFKPPSWGSLSIYTYPWLHGYYSLYSDDKWYKSEHARAEVDTWVDVHQNFWRSRNYVRRFTLSGGELHPERSGRIDNQYGNYYSTNVGQNDTVTIRVGVRLYCEAKANSGRSKLNFQAESANFVYIPYVYWYLHH